MAKHCLNSFKRGGKQFRVLTPTFGVKRHFVEVFYRFFGLRNRQLEIFGALYSYRDDAKLALGFVH